MNHAEIISALEDVLPEIKVTKDPEGTFLKYASAHNLSPAQLERVIHFYNIAKTNNFLDKSANRAAHFKILNSQDVLDKFVTQSGGSDGVDQLDPDAAAWLSVAPSDKQASIVEVYQAIKGEDPIVSAEEMQSLYENRSPDNTAFVKLSTHIAEMEVLNQVLEDEKETFRENLYKLEDWLRGDGLDKFATAERDAKALAIWDISPGVDAIVEFLDTRHVKVARFDNGKQPRLARDTTGFAKIVIDACEAYANVSNAKQVYDQDHELLVDLYKEATQTKKDKDKTTGGHKGEAHERPARRDDSFRQPYSDAPEPQGLTPEENLWMAEHPMVPGKKKDKREPDKPVSVMDQIQKALDGLPWAKDHMTPYKSLMGPGGIVDQVRPKTNKGQKMLDQAHLDDRAQTVLQHLLINDEILSEAEPERVVRLFNTVYKASPDVALDEEVAAMAVREALQYDSLPLHTYKDLTDINKGRTDAARAQADLANKRYSL